MQVEKKPLVATAGTKNAPEKGKKEKPVKVGQVKVWKV